MVVKIPILFLVFNRLDTTKQVFEEIKKARPKKLYVAADGPRNIEEEKKTDAVRKHVLDNINWNCEVKTLFRKKNLGCGKAVSQAITWFFKNEEMGIILEDDCLPSQSFFPFCEELLKKYKNDEKVMQISGFNPVSKNKYSDTDYLFSYSGSIWGWATWRRAWEKYDFDMKTFPKFKKLNKIENFYFNKKIIKSKLKNFELIYLKKIDTWDYQWSYSRLFNQGISIISSKNLIRNIGFGIESSNNKGSGKRFFFMKLENIIFPIIHQSNIKINEKFDIDFYKFFNRSVVRRIIDFLWYF
ncbi:MAG: nucleotide-diphospho-sugar transferase [Candidatus ainarchaeum sp.]|nr:nucleotide-diphospho-sugar transferase [Candidatus ainarchaeum sp.]